MNAPSRVRLDTGWLFGGSVALPGPEDNLNPDVVGSLARRDLDDSAWQPVTMPHTVTPLSWELWDPRSWEKVWAYRHHLVVPPEFRGKRLFLDFEGAMTNATVTINGDLLGEHSGGYLPFSFELTGRLLAADESRRNPGRDRGDADDIIAVVLDSRFNLNVPPNITAAAPSSSVDYWQPGGIHRAVWLRAEPQSFIHSVEVTHHDVLDPLRRRSSLVVRVDSAAARADVGIVAEIREIGGATLASTRTVVSEVRPGVTDVAVEIGELGEIQLWDVDSPTLYELVVTLSVANDSVHSTSLRTGYREARFERDGFYLNGMHRYLMGVNRHGYFPFAGFAMPDRVQRRDAEIIRNELNCVMVRCAHYPQSSAFLDACDELGLLVWEEAPGWQHVGDSDWQDRAADDIANMIARDRHRPSVIVWGARLNETPDRPAFYARTEALVKSLDPTRATSGTMHGDYSRSAVFQHDVFSFDDYTTRIDEDGQRRPTLLEPADDRPYLVTEAVSTRSSPTTFYRRSESALVQQHQALDYAHAHNDAMGDRRFAGLLAWGAFDYHSKTNNHYRGLKTGGLADTFRVLKGGAAIYRAQVSPARRVVIEPAFVWDPPFFLQPHPYRERPESKSWGPGEKAMICSNCDRLEVYLGADHVGTIFPDRGRFPHLPFAPSFVDLRLADRTSWDLRIDGYLGHTLALTRQFSGDRTMDSLALAADDVEIIADGVDATRVVLMVTDRFGNARSSARALAAIEVSGPGQLVGDPTIDLELTGAVAAVWVRGIAGREGAIVVRVTTTEFGSASALVTSALVN